MTLTLHPGAYIVRGLAGDTLADEQIMEIDLLQTGLEDPAALWILRDWYADQARRLGLTERPRLYCVMADAGLYSVHVWPPEERADWLALAGQCSDRNFHYRALGPDEVWN